MADGILRLKQNFAERFRKDFLRLIAFKTPLSESINKGAKGMVEWGWKGMNLGQSFRYNRMEIVVVVGCWLRKVDKSNFETQF